MRTGSLLPQAIKGPIKGMPGEGALSNIVLLNSLGLPKYYSIVVSIFFSIIPICNPNITPL